MKCSVCAVEEKESVYNTDRSVWEVLADIDAYIQRERESLFDCPVE